MSRPLDLFIVANINLFDNIAATVLESLKKGAGEMALQGFLIGISTNRVSVCKGLFVKSMTRSSKT